MRDPDCIAFLQWALPRIGLRWEGFRKPRRQVCRRIARRIEVLGLAGVEDYRRKLEQDADEWQVLAKLCRVTISRFLRDRAVWELLGRRVLPELAQAALAAGRRKLRAWSAGCASGEEPYSLRLVWYFEVAPRVAGLSRPGLELEVVATDADDHLLERARRARYPAGCLRELPEAWRRAAFRDGDEPELRPSFRRGIELRCQDLRCASPTGPFDLVLCRNLAWTYFDDSVQAEILDRIASVLRPGSVLVIGGHETLPPVRGEFEAVGRSLYRKA